MAGLGTLQASSTVPARLLHWESQRMGSSCRFLEKQNRAGGRDFLERNGWSPIPGCSSGPFGWHQGARLPTVAEDPKMQVFFLLEASTLPFCSTALSRLVRILSCSFSCARPFLSSFPFQKKRESETYYRWSLLNNCPVYQLFKAMTVLKK